MLVRDSTLVVWSLVAAMVCPSIVLAAWGSGGESVHLKSIEVLTLYSGKMTKGRRSAPVPQLECVSGGTAPCDAYRPRVVQCYNRGWDGEDVQWECKTDMDNAYRFGSIEVSCEGYDHRDDAYVLKGSCGLRYNLDYTKEGHNQQRTHNYYGGGSSYYTKTNQKLSSESYLANFIVMVAVCLMLWAFYKTCVGSRQAREDAWSTTGDDYPAGGGGGYGWFGQGGGTRPTAPPPPGYHSGYDDASCRNRTAGGGTGAGGFWTGAVTGGLLGYMFGNSGRRNYGNYGGYGFGGNGGGGGWSWGSGGGGGSASHSGSTGTRTASGFGGTSRR